MTSRNEIRRRRERRTLAWCLFAAAVLHAGVFLLAPAFEVEPLHGSDAPLDTIPGLLTAPLAVDILFGPPTISEASGSTWTEPDDRILEAEHGVALEVGCGTLPDLPLHGTVRLRVRASGRVDVLGLGASSGSACGDGALKQVAADLWYRWLPNDRFPPPVVLAQPITLVDATGL